MTIAKELKPFKNIHPGEIIKDEIEARGWSREEFSRITGMTTQAVDEILDSECEITQELGETLSNTFGTTPELWMNLSVNYFKRKQETRTEKEIQRNYRDETMTPGSAGKE